MTLIAVENEELPPLNAFLSSVSPGVTNLQSNIHFQHDFNNPNLPKSFVWPLNLASNNANQMAKLSSTYFNVARPPLNAGNGIYESNTYVSLPYHITSLFDKVIDMKIKTNSLDGGMQVGANVGAMMPDPYQLVRLNPGCLSQIITLSNASRNPFDDSNIIDEQQPKNPFAKLTSNFNKLLKLTTPSNEHSEVDCFSDFADLVLCFNPNSPKALDSDFIDYHTNTVNNEAHNNNNNSSTRGSTGSNGNGRNNSNPNSHYFNNLYTYDESYFNVITSINTSKLLVSTHVNVVNVFVLDSELNFGNTHSYATKKPYTSLLDTNNFPEAEKKQKDKEYQKSIEIPLLRFDLKNHLIVTDMKVFKLHNKVPLLILGLNSGEIIIINLFKLTYKVINLNFHKNLTANANEVSYSFSSSSSSPAIKLSPTIVNVPVTSTDILAHPLYEFVLVVGLANGEVLFVNPFNQDDDSSEKKSPKEVVDEDQFVTYFKKFDLSPFNHQKDHSTILGHIKISHKPITCVASTISLMNPSSNSLNPMLVAIGSDDGLVRLFSLPSTYNYDYGTNTNRKSLISDIISNYFQYGLRDLKFSSDFKFLALAGDGDLIELFKFSYYNVNGLLNKNTNSSSGGGRRSRSGTVNSGTSTHQNGNAINLLLSPTATSHSASFDTSNNDVDLSLYPPAVKDIDLVCRLKSHSNSTTKMDFITQDQIFSNSLEDTRLTNSLLYRMVACGDDGKVTFWEFDYKALPKTKKLVKRKIPKDSKDSKEATSTKRPHASSLTKSKPPKPENINLTLPGANTSATGNNMTSILNSHTGSATNLNSALNSNCPSQTNLNEYLTDQLKGATGLYISLFDIRYKKHYSNLLMSQRQINTNKYQAIIHPVLNDKLVPSIEIPVSVIDLSFWLKDGKISALYLDAFNFWAFGRSGDIINYKVN